MTSSIFATNWRFWAALGLSVALLSLMVYQVNLGEIRTVLAEANYFYVIPAVAVYFVAVYFRAVRWKYLLSPLRVLSASRLYPVIVIGYMANNVLPMRLGELVRGYYLARRENFGVGPSLATIGVERVYDGLTLMFLVAASAPVLLATGWFDAAGTAIRTAWTVVIIAGTCGFLCALGLLTLLASWQNAADWVTRLARFVPEKYGREKVLRFIETFLDGLKILSSPRKHLSLFLLSLPVWFGEVGVYLITSHAFDLDLFFGPLWALVLAIALLTATSNLATGVPSVIGGIGPFEVVAQQTLLALGVGASVAAAYATFVHIVVLWLPVNLAGLFILLRQNLSLRQLTSTPATAPQEKAEISAVPPVRAHPGTDLIRRSPSGKAVRCDVPGEDGQ